MTSNHLRKTGPMLSSPRCSAKTLSVGPADHPGEWQEALSDAWWLRLLSLAHTSTARLQWSAVLRQCYVNGRSEGSHEGEIGSVSDDLIA